MDSSKETATPYELFQHYADLLNGQFLDNASALRAHHACISIAMELHKRGFSVFTLITPSTEFVTLSDDLTQQVITFAYELFLFTRGSSVEEPVMILQATSKFFEPPMRAARALAQTPLSPQDEAWLHTILDPLAAKKQI